MTALNTDPGVFFSGNIPISNDLVTVICPDHEQPHNHRSPAAFRLKIYQTSISPSYLTSSQFAGFAGRWPYPSLPNVCILNCCLFVVVVIWSRENVHPVIVPFRAQSGAISRRDVAISYISYCVASYTRNSFAWRKDLGED